MKISSNYYDYYSQMYQLNSLSNAQVNNEDSNSSQDETKAINSIQRRSYVPDGNVDISDLNYSGTMLANSLKLQSNDSSEMSENMETIKTDMDSLKTTDIDNMSSDDVKKLLTKLQTDMAAVNSPAGQSSDISNIDIDSMSESDMKDILEKIQDQANSMPTPPPPPSTEASNVLSKINEDVESIKTEDIDNMSSDDVKKMLTQLKTDMESIKNPYGSSSNTQKIDIDNMSESDMRDMLKKIQEHANKMTTRTEETKVSESFSRIKEDTDTIKAADIDSMSSDDIKKILTQLKNDTESLYNQNGQANDLSNIDIDNMSESDMKDILKKIQEQTNNMTNKII
jgi:cytochrome c556